jgi:hypothetical protein
VLEIIDGPQEPRPVDDEDSKPDLVEVYSLKNGKYAYATTFFFESLFVRKKGNPVTETRTFKVDKNNAQYVLKVVNGDADGKNRVSSSEVALNGKAVVNSINFDQKTALLAVPVTLKADNELKVTLKSPPGSKLRVTVDAKR